MGFLRLIMSRPRGADAAAASTPQGDMAVGSSKELRFSLTTYNKNHYAVTTKASLTLISEVARQKLS